MAQAIEYLPRKHDDLSLDPSTYIKSWCSGMHLDPRVAKRRQEEPRELNGKWAPGSVRASFSKNKVKNSLYTSKSSAHTHTYTHTHIYTHTVHLLASTWTCMCAYIHARACAHTHTLTCAHTYECTHAHTVEEQEERYLALTCGLYRHMHTCAYAPSPTHAHVSLNTYTHTTLKEKLKRGNRNMHWMLCLFYRWHAHAG